MMYEWMQEKRICKGKANCEEGVGATVGKMVACKTRQQTETVKKKELPVWVFNIVGLVS